MKPNLTAMCSVGESSPRCKRRSQSSGVPNQHIHQPYGFLSRQLRQRRQPWHADAKLWVRLHPDGDEPVVGGGPRGGAVRPRRQVHQQRYGR